MCPKSDNNDQYDDSDLKERIKALEQAIQMLSSDGNNYVLFDVNTDKSQLAYWPEENQDLWRIVTNGSNTTQLKIMYDQNVLSNNYLNIKNANNFEDNLIKHACTEKTPYGYVYLDDIEKAVADYFVFDEKDSVCVDSEGKRLKFIYYDKYFYSGSSNDEKITNTKGYEKYFNGNICNGLTDHFGSKDEGKASITIDSYKKIRYTLQNINSTYYCKPSQKYKDSDKYKYIHYETSDGWGYAEIFGEDNTKKDLLYKAIKDDLKKYIKESKYCSTYQGAYNDYSNIDGNSCNSFYESKLGTVSINDVREETKINNWLTGKTFAVGRYHTSYFSKEYNNYLHIVNGVVSSGSDFLEKADKTGVYQVATEPYIPLITLDVVGASWIDYSKYPVNYKSTYPSCTEDKLGTKECPYVIRFNDGTYSWND